MKGWIGHGDWLSTEWSVLLSMESSAVVLRRAGQAALLAARDLSAVATRSVGIIGGLSLVVFCFVVCWNVVFSPWPGSPSLVRTFGQF